MEVYNIPDHLHGDTFDGVEFEILVNGLAKDLTGADIKIEFRKQKKTGELVHTITVGSGITITDAAAGKFTIDAFTVTFGPGTFYYDAQITIAGVVKTYIGGTWAIVQDVTA